MIFEAFIEPADRAEFRSLTAAKPKSPVLLLALAFTIAVAAIAPEIVLKFIPVVALDAEPQQTLALQRWLAFGLATLLVALAVVDQFEAQPPSVSETKAAAEQPGRTNHRGGPIRVADGADATHPVPIEFQLLASGFQFREAAGTVFVPWDRLQAFVEGARAFHLLVGQGKGFILPKVDGLDVEMVRRMLEHETKRNAG